jgi:uncharacterized protein
MRRKRRNEDTASTPKIVEAPVNLGRRTIGLVYGVPPNSQPSSCLFLAHGVTGTMNSSLVKYLHSKLAELGFLTVRFNFPYAEGRWRRLQRRDRTDVLVTTYRKVIEQVRESEWKPKNLFLGGISLGAAVASHVVADGPEVPGVHGLFFLSYPIHLPRKPERLGIEHLEKISLPMLFISGTDDKYAYPSALKLTGSQLGNRAQVHMLEGANQGFKKDGRVHSKTLDEISEIVQKWTNALSS